MHIELLTCQSLHPGSFINAQIIDHDLHDAAQKLIELFGGDISAETSLLLREVLRSSLPPARQVVTQHGQGDLNHVRHLCVPCPTLRQISDLLHQHIKLRDVQTQLLYLTGQTQN